VSDSEFLQRREDEDFCLLPCKDLAHPAYVSELFSKPVLVFELFDLSVFFEILLSLVVLFELFLKPPFLLNPILD
jgi:hypothetical protein